jgi:hypothetical protein
MTGILSSAVKHVALVLLASHVAIGIGVDAGASDPPSPVPVNIKP